MVKIQLYAKNGEFFINIYGEKAIAKMLETCHVMCCKEMPIVGFSRVPNWVNCLVYNDNFFSAVIIVYININKIKLSYKQVSLL